VFYNFYLQFFVFVDDDDLLLLLLLVATVIVLGLIIISYCLAYQNLNADKIAAYECGFQPFEDIRQRFDIKYYMIGILFIIFDLEIMFILP
jgi:NADH-quinone oxidoreductase subunit A